MSLCDLEISRVKMFGYIYFVFLENDTPFQHRPSPVDRSEDVGALQWSIFWRWTCKQMGWWQIRLCLAQKGDTWLHDDWNIETAWFCSFEGVKRHFAVLPWDDTCSRLAKTYTLVGWSQSLLHYVRFFKINAINRVIVCMWEGLNEDKYGICET